MKVEINIIPWYLPMLVELPIQPMFGTNIELSEKDLNRYIGIIKSSDFASFEETKDELADAPDTIGEDEEEFWGDLFFNTEVKEVNIVWSDEANAYIPQVILGKPYDFDNDFDDEEEEDTEEQ